MPKKKKKEEEFVHVDPAPELCAHRNMHYTAGVLICELLKGHNGNHAARLNGKESRSGPVLVARW